MNPNPLSVKILDRTFWHFCVSWIWLLVVVVVVGLTVVGPRGHIRPIIAVSVPGTVCDCK